MILVSVSVKHFLVFLEIFSPAGRDSGTASYADKHSLTKIIFVFDADMNKTGIYVRMIIVAPKTKNSEVVIKIHAVSDLGYIGNSGVMTSKLGL